MILRKRYKRDIRHNLSLYVSSTLLTVLSLALFYLYYICGSGILDFKNDYFAEQKIEDANFSTYKEIPDDEIKKYEEKYDLELEKQHFINIENGKVTARVFKKTEKIDLYSVVEGKDVSSDNEVLISKGYAKNCGFSIGDQIKIKDKNYTISGYVERPDYLYMLQNLTDSYKNITSFYICYMTDEEFESLGETACQYLVRYHQDNIKEFRKKINDEFIMQSYVSSDENYRISMFEEQPELFLIMSYIILFTVPLIAVIFISVILSRKIKSEQKMIGTLTAYGYTKRQIIWHYAGFSAIPGIVGGIVTTIAVYLSADWYGSIGLMDYEPLTIDFKLGFGQMALGLIVPTLMYILSSAVTVNKLMKHDVTELLAGSVKGKERVKKLLVGKKVSFRTKFSVRSFIGNKGRTFALFIGAFLGSLVIFFALCDYDSIMNISDDTVENMGDYNYQYMLNKMYEKNKYGGETILAASVENDEGDTISLFGADENKLISLKDKTGEKLEIDDSYYVTSLYAKMKDIKEGDKIKVFNPMSMEEYEIKISRIVDNNFAKAIYTSRKNVSKVTGLDQDQFNMILSKDKLDLPDETVVTSISRKSIDDQYKAVLTQMKTVLYLLAGIGVFLCIISVYLAVNMVVTENRSNISMLRVLGYHDKKIDRLLLHDNIFIVLAAMILSIPCMFAIAGVMFSSFVDVLGYMIEVYIKPSTYFICISLVLVSYYVSVFFVSKKIKKIDMVESLKDHRE